MQIIVFESRVFIAAVYILTVITVQRIKRSANRREGGGFEHVRDAYMIHNTPARPLGIELLSRLFFFVLCF